jgi:ArsR family transcriptional regulator
VLDYASIVIEAMAFESTVGRAEESIQLMSAAADPVRWRLLTELSAAGTRCVCDLQPVAAVAPNVLSYHLKVLREAGLVTSAKRGRWVDYTLAPAAHARLQQALPTTGVLAASTL